MNKHTHKHSIIHCPHCQHEIDIDQQLGRQLEQDIEAKFANQYAQKLAEQQKLQQHAANALKQAQDEFEAKKRQENALFQQRLDKQLKEERIHLEKSIKDRFSQDNAEQFRLLQSELNEKSEQIKELNRSKAEVEKLKRENAEIKEIAEADAQKKLNEMLMLERDKIRKLEQDKNELMVLELKKQLEDQRKLTEEMKRKQEQGSMQLQGEVLELAIEEWLASQFPLDSINEIKKGATGADCVHIVNTREHQNCGVIYYESKRTKAFQPAWIEKFKQDIRAKNANLGVLVTEVMPSDMPRMGLKEGIWICTFDEFKGLSQVLRQSVINLHQAVLSQENKGDKIHMLYDFLTSNAFRLQIEGIVEGFTQMKTDLDKEKRAMASIWKQREKQLEKVIENTIGMYGSIKGIAGSAIQSIQLLELPAVDGAVDGAVDLLE